MSQLNIYNDGGNAVIELVGFADRIIVENFDANDLSFQDFSFF